MKRDKKSIYLEGSQLNYSVSLRMRYEKKLKELSRKMTRDTRKELQLLIDAYLKQLTSSESKNYTENEILVKEIEIAEKLKDKNDELLLLFLALFSKKSSKLAQGMVKEAQVASKNALNSSIKKISGEKLPQKDLPVSKQVFTDLVNKNKDVIESIPEKYFKKLNREVTKLTTPEYDIYKFNQKIKEYDEQIERYVKNISINETEKVYSSINFESMMQLGIDEFRWKYNFVGQHSRIQHIGFNRQIFNIRNLPISNETGEGVFPGWLEYCHCTAVPVYKLPIGKK